MVGAVLVGGDGEVLGTAHRGNLREGEHAEYTLIERLLPDRDLEGTTLYVTLEPCTARSFPKKPCAERVVSARIGRVFVGMLDPNPNIHGNGVELLLANRVSVEFFDHDLMERIQEENRAFISQFEQGGEVGDEGSVPVEGASKRELETITIATIEDFSREVIFKYLQARNRTHKVPSEELWEFFSRSGFLVKNPVSQSYVPTLVGILLFGRDLEDLVSQSIVKVEAHLGTRVVTADIHGPLLTITDQIEEFLMRNMRTFTEIHGFKRVEVPEYPWEALREGIVNALVHRDYRAGVRIHIKMLKDRIVIMSPGLPLRPLTLNRIRSYNAPPFSRNPHLAAAFAQMGLMEERGTGLRRMRDHLAGAGLREPKFTVDTGYFVVTVFGYQPKMDVLSISSDVSTHLNDRQIAILGFIRDEGRSTSSECASKFDVDVSTIKRDFKMLRELGLIVKKGISRATHYILAED